MAKSLRSKIKQRYRRAKRHYIERTLHSTRINDLHRRVKKLQQGLSLEPARPKNAFLYPDDLEATFPQIQLRDAIDFRSEALPLAGYAVTGCRRHFTDEEKLTLDLAVRCKDGLLSCERESAVEHSPNSHPGDENVEAEALASQVKHAMRDMSALTTGSSSAPPINTAELDELCKLQERVGGRSKNRAVLPKIRDNLRKTRRQGRT